MFIRLYHKAMPAPRPRARAFIVKGKPIVSMYHPKEYTEYQAELAKAIKAQLPPDFVAFAAPVSVALDIVVTRPKTSKLWAPKPDVDNYAKGVLDSVVKAGVVDDDSLVVDLHVSKRWGEADFIAIDVSETEDFLL